MTARGTNLNGSFVSFLKHYIVRKTFGGEFSGKRYDSVEDERHHRDAFLRYILVGYFPVNLLSILELSSIKNMTKLQYLVQTKFYITD